MKNKQNIPIPQDSDIKNAFKSEGDFKQSLVDTLQESNTARTEMKSVLHELLRQQDTTQEIKEIINKIDRDAVKVFWSKFGFTVWSTILYILGVATTLIIGKFIK